VCKAKPTKEWKIKEKKLDAGSSTIIDAIKNISTSVKEREKMMMEMTERITTHILQSEQIDKELIEQGQLQTTALFVEYLMPKNS
jgi:uncharacterized protein YoxC